jgi:hypothetical protein
MGRRSCEKMQGHGLAPIRTDQNKELICVDPCSSVALIIFSQLRMPVPRRGFGPARSGHYFLLTKN